MPVQGVQTTQGGTIQALHPHPNGTLTIAIGATSASATRNFAAEVIRIVANIAVNVALGPPTGTAATGLMFIPGNSPEYFAIAPSGWSLAAVGATVTATGVVGTLWVTECF